MRERHSRITVAERLTRCYAVITRELCDDGREPPGDKRTSRATLNRRDVHLE